MAARQREWARRWRDKLRSELGGKCAKCGHTGSKRYGLEFDVIIPVGNDDHHRRMEWSWRMSFYRRQHERHNLQILCSKCNGSKKDNMNFQLYDSPEQPF